MWIKGLGRQQVDFFFPVSETSLLSMHEVLEVKNEKQKSIKTSQTRRAQSGEKSRFFFFSPFA